MNATHLIRNRWSTVTLYNCREIATLEAWLFGHHLSVKLAGVEPSYTGWGRWSW